MVYCTPAEVREAGTQITESAPVKATDAYLLKLIERASRFFDSVVGVAPGFFEPSGATATARTFYGDGTNFLRLDAYVDGSLNATISVPEGYEAPTYIARDGYLVLTTSEGGILHQWPPFPSWWRIGAGWWAGVPITVTAKWGYSATPADVKLAVIELTINLLRETDPAAIKLINTEGLAIREKLPPRVRAIAELYRRKETVLV
jgi:hypothetical protein